MKRLGLGLGLLLLLTASAHGAIVTGYCTVSDSAALAGTEVVFLRSSWRAQTVSAFTDSAGYFELSVVPGYYNVIFSRPGYQKTELFGFEVGDANVDLGTWQLWPVWNDGLTGVMIDSLGPGDFRVVGDLFVPPFQSLALRPGTRLLFTGPYRIFVGGSLSALGTAADSIVFTRETETAQCLWSGLYVDAAGFPQDSAIRDTATANMRYCRIDHVQGTEYTHGGAIFLGESARLTAGHCLFRDNSAGDGGAIWSSGAALHLDSCVFARNSAEREGGALYALATTSPVVVEHCDFDDNFAGNTAVRFWINAVFRHCRIRSAGSQPAIALALTMGSFTVTDVHVENASTGVELAACDSGLNFSDCVISQCETGLDLNGTEGEVRITGTVFRQCANEAVKGTPNSTARFERCTFWDNGAGARVMGNFSFNGCVFAANTAAGMTFSPGVAASVRHSAFHNTVSFSQLANAPALLGVKLITNVNGDSTDVYGNLFADPLFVDAAAGDFHLTPTSPCIDAGDPFWPLQPDGTPADIGTFPTTLRIAVSPRSLAFDSVAVGDSLEREVTITNTSELTTTVRIPQPGSPMFTVVAAPDSIVLAPAESVTVTVRFLPDSCATYRCPLSVVETAGERLVRMQATGLGAYLVPQTLNLDMGTVGVGSTATRWFKITNVGNIPLTLGPPNMAIGPSVFTVTAQALSIPAGGTDSLAIHFTPAAAGAVQGVLWAKTNAYNLRDMNILLAGLGETGLVPQPVTDLTVFIEGNDARLVWSPVTLTQQGNPLVVDAYLVYYSEDAIGPFFFHGLTTTAGYRHANVVQFAYGMHYQVTAYIGSVPQLQSVLEALGEHPSKQTVHRALESLR